MVEKVTPPGEGLLAIRERFLSQMIFQTFNGYAMSQFKKIEQDIRNQITSDLRSELDRRRATSRITVSPTRWP